MKSKLNYRSYRVKKFKNFTSYFKSEQISDLVVAHKINKKLYNKLTESSKNYLRLSKKHNLLNMTPNGKLMPKKEIESSFNDIVITFRDIILSLNINHLIKKWTIPAIRYKEENINKLNIKRSSRSELAHSDAWAGWGEDAVLLQIPILGDTINNRVNYYDLPDDFNKTWMKKYSFEKAQKFAKKCKKINHHYKKGYIYLADISVIHSTHRRKNSKPRMSIDIPLIISSKKNYDKKFENEIISKSTMNKLGSKYKIQCKAKMDEVIDNNISLKRIN